MKNIAKLVFKNYMKAYNSKRIIQLISNKTKTFIHQEAKIKINSI